MNRIQQYLILILFLLFNSNTIRSLEDNNNDNLPTTPQTSPAHASTRNKLSNIISPQPRRFFIVTLNEINEQLKEQEEASSQRRTENEKCFRSQAHWQMADPGHQIHMQNELCNILFFVITNIQLDFKNGFYQKVNFFTHNNSKLPPECLTSLVLPLWVVRPFLCRYADGRLQTQYVPQFYGYAYKRNDGNYWRWVDADQKKEP